MTPRSPVRHATAWLGSVHLHLLRSLYMSFAVAADDLGIDGCAVGADFVILGILPGRYASSRVFEGRHVRLGYPAVVRLDDRPSPSELTIEGAALSRITHGCVPRLLGRGRMERPSGFTDYLVREFAPGYPLSALLRAHRRLDPSRVLGVAQQLISAISASHHQGVVHGDIKPENVIVDPDDRDRLLLVDFGSAVIDGEPNRAERTPRYCAPEVIAGQIPTVQSDIYSLGVLLRECLVGYVVEPSSSSVISLHPMSEPERVGPLAWDVPLPRALRLVVERATAPSPSDRHPSADELGEALALLDERELAHWYLGPFPPGERTDEPTINLPTSKTFERGAPPSLGLPGLHAVPRPMGPADFDPPPLASLEQPTIWVLCDTPSTTAPTLRAAFDLVAKRFEVRFLDDDSREQVRLDVQQGRERLPWIVVFGDVHVLLGDTLLEDLAAHGETMRMLISSHSDLALAQSAVNATGLDHRICLPVREHRIIEAVSSLLGRCARRRRYYDGLRLALLDASQHTEDLMDGLT